MVDLLFGLPCVRQRRVRIYQYNDSILIYSNQKFRTCYRFGRASIEYNTNLIEADLQTKANCYYALKPIDQVLIALQFYVSGGGRPRLKWYYGIMGLWDTYCRLARQYKWFLHLVLTVNQRLTNLPSNRALNNVLNSSD